MFNKWGQNAVTPIYTHIPQYAVITLLSPQRHCAVSVCTHVKLVPSMVFCISDTKVHPAHLIQLSSSVMRASAASTSLRSTGALCSKLHQTEVQGNVNPQPRYRKDGTKTRPGMTPSTFFPSTFSRLLFFRLLFFRLLFSRLSSTSHGAICRQCYRGWTYNYPRSY